MASLMQQHRNKVQAARAKAGAVSGKVTIATMPKAAPGLMGVSQTGELIDKALQEDLAALKGLTSFERKAEFKRNELIPRYRDSVKLLVQGGKPHPAIAYYLVWCFDARLIAEALELALWAIEHDQTLPEGFNSTVPFFAASQVADWADAEFSAGHDFEPYLSQCFEAMEQGKWNVDDATRARFFRLYGLKALQDEKLADAVSQLERALALGAQVKSKLAEAKKKLEKAEAAKGKE